MDLAGRDAGRRRHHARRTAARHHRSRPPLSRARATSTCGCGRHGGATRRLSVTHVVADPTLRTGWPRKFGRDSRRSNVTLADLDGDGGKEIVLRRRDQLVRAPGRRLRSSGVAADGASTRSRSERAPPSVADHRRRRHRPKSSRRSSNGIDMRHADGTLVVAVVPGAYPPGGVIALVDIDGDGRTRPRLRHRTAAMARSAADGTIIPVPDQPVRRHCATGTSRATAASSPRRRSVTSTATDGPRWRSSHNDARGRQYLAV